MIENNILSSIKGALASTLVLLALLVVSLFVFPNSPEEFGEHFFGVGILSGMLPLVLVLLFFYYLILGLMKIRSFNFALFTQLIFYMLLAAMVYFSIVPRAGAVLFAFYTFIFLSVAGAFGAWAWSARKNT